MASLLPKGVDRPQPQRRGPTPPSRTASGATTSTDAVLRRAAPNESAPPPPGVASSPPRTLTPCPRRSLAEAAATRLPTPHTPGIITPGSPENPATRDIRARSGSRSFSRNLHYDGRGGGIASRVYPPTPVRNASNKHDTGWARGAPSEDHTTPPSARNASSGRLVGGAPARARPLREWLIPRVWSHKGTRPLPLLPAPVKVTCARTSSNRAAVCACMRRVNPYPSPIPYRGPKRAACS
eukprot:scaffold10813_cov65-Phaeocystis_antarctica.AAC.5